MPIVRVAVLAAADDGGRLTEMALPAELPLREILPAVQRLVLPSNDEAEASTISEPLSLAPIGGAPFSLDATLDTVGVVDGDLLALQPVPAGPPAPRIVEDIADAAVIFSAARERPWGIDHIRRAAAAAVIGLILVTTGLAVAHRVATGEALGLFTVSGLAAATVLAALLSRIRSPRLATALSVTALAPVAAALAAAVPGDFGAPQLILAAAGVTAWSIISLTIGDRAIAVFTATAVTGFGVALAAAANAVWELPITSLGCGLIVLALLVTVQAAQLSAACARSPCRLSPHPAIRHRRHSRCGCSRICPAGSGSATRIRPDSSPAVYCWPSSVRSRSSDQPGRLHGRGTWRSPPRWARRFGPGCGTPHRARSGCWVIPIW
jgi:type VII secretion integral membrane protein EccD